MKARQEAKQEAAVSKADPDVRIFSPVKYKIMLVLKKEGQADLETLSRKLSISQMAVYKHVRELENKGLLEHVAKRIGVGRPRLVFKPSSRSLGVYPSAYSGLAVAALETMEKRLGRESVKGAMKQMQSGMVPDLALPDGDVETRVRKLAAARDSHGYMAEVVRTPRGTIELREHNCPLAAVSARYPELCEVERQSLEKALGTRVKSLTLSPGGGPACVFEVRSR